MTDCQDWLNELTYTSEQILNEDLAALKRMPDRSRIERYNEIKSNEEEFSWEFGKECSDFLTGNEEDRLRGELRLARLLLAASLYSEGELPKALEGDLLRLNSKPSLSSIVTSNSMRSAKSRSKAEFAEWKGKCTNLSKTTLLHRSRIWTN